MTREIKQEMPFPDHRERNDSNVGLSYPFDVIPDFGEVYEVAEGLLWLRMPLIFDLNHINLYLIKDTDGWVIVDSGLNTSMVRDMWTNVLTKTLQGAPITKVVCTHYHPDHMGLAGWLVEQTGAPLHMTGLEMLTGRSLMQGGQAEVPQQVIDFYVRAGFDDEQMNFVRNMGYGNFSKVVWPLPFSYKRMRAGDDLKIGNYNFNIWVGNGHSPEHACLYDPDKKILISGDQLLPRITSNISVYATEPYSNPLKDWFDSLLRFKKLSNECLVLPAHNEPFYGMHERADEMVNGHIRRLIKLQKTCEDGCSAADAFPALYARRLKGFDMIMGLGESLAHLHYLENLGCLRRESEGDHDKFCSVKQYDKSMTLIGV